MKSAIALLVFVFFFAQCAEEEEFKEQSVPIVTSLTVTPLKDNQFTVIGTYSEAETQVSKISLFTGKNDGNFDFVPFNKTEYPADSFGDGTFSCTLRADYPFVNYFIVYLKAGKVGSFTRTYIYDPWNDKLSGPI